MTNELTILTDAEGKRAVRLNGHEIKRVKSVTVSVADRGGKLWDVSMSFFADAVVMDIGPDGSDE